MPLIHVHHASPMAAQAVEDLIYALTTAYSEVTSADPGKVQVRVHQTTADRWGVGGTALKRPEGVTSKATT